MNRLACVLILSAAIVALMMPAAADACPNCVNSVAADTSTGSPGTSGSMAGGIGGSMAAGYYYSILFMLGMLFSVAGIFIFVVWRHARASTVLPVPSPAD